MGKKQMVTRRDLEPPATSFREREVPNPLRPGLFAKKLLELPTGIETGDLILAMDAPPTGSFSREAMNRTEPGG